MIIKSCFGPDDDEDEKFEIKHKKERKVSYRPNDPNKKTNKKKNKKNRKTVSEGKDQIKHFNNNININFKKSNNKYMKYPLK